MIESSAISAELEICPQKNDYARKLQAQMKRKIAKLFKNLICNQEHSHSVLILDMDGTLYPHDGPQNGFKGSTKEQLLTQLHLDYILSKEPHLDDQQIRALFVESLNHPIGPSIFLSERYGCSREETFSTIWTNLHPKDFIEKKSANSAQKILQDVRSRVCTMLLVTSAPALWKNKVLTFLGIDNSIFDIVMTTEDFETKEDVFRQISEIHPAIHGISVGDTESSDILPPKNLGFQTLHINDKNSLTDIHHLLDST